MWDPSKLGKYIISIEDNNRKKHLFVGGNALCGENKNLREDRHFNIVKSIDDIDCVQCINLYNMEKEMG